MKLTPERQKRICDAIRAGCPRVQAAQAAGVHEATLYRWLASGRKEKKGRFARFARAVKRAEAKAVGDFVKVIHDAAPKSWQAAAWWLERRHPELFALKGRTEADGDKPTSKLTVEEVPCRDAKAPPASH